MQQTLKYFSQQLEKKPLCRQGLFLAAALFSIVMVGYHFGTFDQSVHLPFLKAIANPSLYANDPFIVLGKDQFSFFWYLFLPFLKLGILEPVMFLVHLLGTSLFFMAIWNLAMTLFGEPLAALFSVLCFIAPHTGFVGFPVIEFSLLSRTLVLPFLLFAVNNFLRQRYGSAFLILGLIYNLNLLMTNFVLIFLIFSSLVEIRRIGWKKLVYGLGLFFVGALPVLIWKFRSGTGIDLSLRSEWFSAVTRGVLYQVFNIFSLTPFMLLTLGGISCIALFLVARKNYRSNAHSRQITHFMAALIGIMVFHVITTYWLPLTSIIQMQFSRASIFILIFAYICFAGDLIKEYLSKRITGGNMLLVTGCLFLSLSPTIPLIAWGIYRKYPTLFKERSLAVGAILAIMTAIYSLGFTSINLWKPGIQIYARPSAWLDVQNWAKNNTAKDAMFITPPQEVGLYQPDWRVFSERGTVASLYDLFEIALKPEYYPIWKPRFQSLAPGALEKFQDNFFENKEITRKAFNDLKKDQFLNIAAEYNATYLVTERKSDLDLPVAYENDQYSILMLNDNFSN
jgi:hypothetical protein